MWKWLNDLLNPHAHVWTNVATLHDNPDKPTATVVVQTCDICGEGRKLEFRAPPVPAAQCPPHKWRTLEKTEIAGAKAGVISGLVYTLRCECCGELSSRTLTNKGISGGSK